MTSNHEILLQNRENNLSQIFCSTGEHRTKVDRIVFATRVVMSPAKMKKIVTSFNDYYVEGCNATVELIDDPSANPAFEHANSDMQRFRSVDASASASLDFKFGQDPDGKCAKKSVKNRLIGDTFFAQGDEKLLLASMAYNDAIRYAPWPSSTEPGLEDNESSCLAVAFANRSAVLYRMQHYSEAIKDIDRAIAFGYSKAKRSNLLVRKASAFIRIGKFEAAIECLLSVFVAPGMSEGSGDGPWNEPRWPPHVEALLHEAHDGLKNPELSQAAKLLGSPVNPTGKIMKARLNEKHSLKEGPHKVFPAVSSALQLSYNHDHGRLFTANESIDVGDVVLIESPYVQGLQVEYLHTNCDACTMWAIAPFPCRGCTRVVFCSEDCANGEKAQFHARECAYLWMLIDFPDKNVEGRHDACIDILLCVFRTLGMKTAEEWRRFACSFPGNSDYKADKKMKWIANPTRYDSQDYSNIFCLAKPTSNRRHGIILAECVGAYFAFKVAEKAFFSEEGNELDPALRDYVGGIAIRHYGSFTVNAAGLVDAEKPDKNNVFCIKRGIGRAIYPTYALFNSSCQGNVCEARFGNDLVLRACRPIEKGEAVFVSHLTWNAFAYHKLEKRRSLLLTLKGFYCRCVACESDWPDLTSVDEAEMREMTCLKCGNDFYYPIARKNRKKPVKCRKCGWDVDSFYDLLRRIVDDPDETFKWTIKRPSDEAFALLEKAARMLNPCHNVLIKIDCVVRNNWAWQGNRRVEDASGLAKKSVQLIQELLQVKRKDSV